MIGALEDVVGNTGFQLAFVVGASFTAMAGVVAWTLRRTLPIGGLVVAFGFVVAVIAWSTLPASATWGLLLLSAGGLVAEIVGRRRATHPIVRGAFALPGAVALSTTTESFEARWIPALMVCVIATAGPLAADFDERGGARSWSLVCYAISAGGVYLTVPDTELAIILFGVSIPALFLSWPTAFASLGWPGAYAAVGSLVWVGALEARGRPAALLGAVGCLGLLIAEPIAVLMRDWRRSTFARLSQRRRSLLPVAAGQCALVLIASRIAGRTHNVRAATLLTAAEIAAAVAVLWYVQRSHTATRPDGESM
jgi:hypothetical protein